MKKITVILYLVFAASLILLTGCASIAAASPGSDGEITILLEDYKFDPDTIRLKAGQRVSLVLSNQGDKTHELMIGRNTQIHDGQTEVFAVDFFEGIEVESSGPGMAMRMGEMDMDMEGMDMEGMDMGGDEEGGMEGMDMEGEEHEEGEHEAGEMEGMDTEGEEHEEGEHKEGEMEGMDMGTEEPVEGEHEETEMEGMDMGTEEPSEGDAEDMHMEGDEHEEETMEGMDMGGEHEDEHDQGPMGEFGPYQSPLMDQHPGFMVLLDPLSMTPSGEVTVLTFTVPEDKVGTWTIGCFQEGGQHFDDGMRGTLIVEP